MGNKAEQELDPVTGDPVGEERGEEVGILTSNKVVGLPPDLHNIPDLHAIHCRRELNVRGPSREIRHDVSVITAVATMLDTDFGSAWTVLLGVWSGLRNSGGADRPARIALDNYGLTHPDVIRVAVKRMSGQEWIWAAPDLSLPSLALNSGIRSTNIPGILDATQGIVLANYARAHPYMGTVYDRGAWLVRRGVLYVADVDHNQVTTQYVPEQALITKKAVEALAGA